MRELAVALEKLLGLAARLFFGAAAVALSAIVGLIVASVVMRRLVGAPLYYTEELVGLLLSASLFLALPMVTLKAQHVRVTFLAQMMPPRARAALALVAGGVTLAFCAWFLIEAVPWLEFAVRRNIRSEAANLRLAPWMAVPPVSIALCALLLLARLITGSEQRSFDSTRQDA